MEDRTLQMALYTGSYLLAREIARQEHNIERAGKMRAVAAKKRQALDVLVGPDCPIENPRIFLRSLTCDWDRDTRLRLMIDLSFCDPFAPYMLDFDRKRLVGALTSLAAQVGVDPDWAERIEDTRRDAGRAHGQRKWGRLALVGLASSAVMAAGGWVAAPAIAAALGGAAGLSGAAATSFGLALLGGGGLAAGGAGVAGGMLLVTGTGAALGLVGGAGGTLLFQLGADQMRTELIKLQVNYKLIVLHGEADIAKGQAVIANLEADQRRLKETLEEERQLNDDHSARLQEIEEKVEAIEHGVTWMRAQTTLNAQVVGA